MARVVVHHALLRWYRTQGREPECETDDVGLIADPRLHAARTPGNTCLDALSQARRFGDPAKNDSKGCGTIMRVAPVALFARESEVRELALETLALTHGHPTGRLAAAAWAEILAAVKRGADLRDTARAVAEEYRGLEAGSETAAAIMAALSAPQDGRAETVESLGGGWVAEEALAIALYSCLATEGLEQGLRMAVTHSGDSDSTGAIAGNMLGLLYPDQVFQHPWAEQVECADIIRRLAHDASSTREMGTEEIDRRCQLYPAT